MQTGIKSQLIRAFLTIVAVFWAASVSIIIIHFVLVGIYRNISDKLITEYSLTDTTSNLILSYNTFFKNPTPENRQQYDINVQKLIDFYKTLDVAITNQQSRADYKGLKNSIQSVLDETNGGIQSILNNDISGISAHYNEANRKYLFVKDNVSTLIIDELTDAQQSQGKIQILYFGSLIIMILVLFSAITGVIIFSINFAKKITEPIIKLSGIASDITNTKGQINFTISDDLLKGSNEIGVLAQSFNRMVLDVEKRINDRTQELQQEHARLLASINNLPLGFLLLDTAGNVVLSNHMAQELFPQKETLTSISNLFVPVVDINELNRLGKERQSYELQEAKLGERSFHIMATPVVISQPHEEDEIIGSVVLAEDITQEKMLEQSKDAFLAIAAHEMRTPLTVIRGNAELLLDEPSTKANAGLKVQIESVLNSAVRLLGIVNDFLDVQNLEGGRISPNIEPVDIVALLTDSIRELSALALKKGLTLTFNIPSDFNVPLLNLDKYRLQQVYINLLSNAIHYTERGGVTITLQKEEGFVKILFEDTGIGISAEEQGRLFKKFETGRVFMQSREYGSGLGLYISRFLAHLMEGDVVLEKSEVGKGSIFSLKLPLGKDS